MAEPDPLQPSSSLGSAPSSSSGGGGGLSDIEAQAKSMEHLASALGTSAKNAKEFTSQRQSLTTTLRELGAHVENVLRPLREVMAISAGTPGVSSGIGAAAGHVNIVGGQKPTITPSKGSSTNSLVGGGSTVSGDPAASRPVGGDVRFQGDDVNATLSKGMENSRITFSRSGEPDPPEPGGDDGRGRNGGGSRFGGTAAAVGGGIALVGAYVRSREFGRANADYLYQQASFSGGGSGSQAARDVMRTQIMNQGVAGALNDNDYNTALMATRMGGAVTAQQLGARMGGASFLASLSPGMGLAQAQQGEAGLYTPQTMRFLRQYTGVNFDIANRGPGQMKQIFNAVMQRGQINSAQSLSRAFTAGTVENTAIRQFDATTQQAFREYAENRLVPGRDRTDNELSASIRKAEEYTRNSLEVEGEIADTMEDINDMFATVANTANPAIKAFADEIGLATAALGTLGGPLAQLTQSALGLIAADRLLNRGGGGGDVDVDGKRVKRTKGGMLRKVGGAVMKSAGALLGGEAVGSTVDAMTDGRGGLLEKWGNVGASAARGAGVGAAVASFIPIPVASTLVGGVVGGLVGGLHGGYEAFVGDPHEGHNHGPKNRGGLDPRMGAALQAMLRDNPRLKINSAHRSSKEQAALYASGKSPVAPGGSKHEQGVAADIGPSSEYGWLRMNASKYGLEHITQSEPWHVELRGARSPYDKAASLNAEHAMGGGTPGTGAYAQSGTEGADLSEIPNYGKMPPEIKGQETMSTLLAYLRKRLSKDVAPVTSGYRPGSRTAGSGNVSNHARGKALDISAPGHGDRGYDSPGLRAIWDHFWPIRSHLRELILTGADQWVGRGSTYTPNKGGVTWDTHKDHVHVSTDAKSLPGVVVPTEEDVNPVSGGGGFAPKLGDTYGSVNQLDFIRSILSGGGSVSATSQRNDSSTGSGTSNNLATSVAGDIPGTIIRIGQTVGANKQAILAALEAGWVESNYRTGKDVAYKDLDSIGVMQQRAAWAGEAKNIHYEQSKRNDPAWAARAFYMGGEGGQPGALSEQRRRDHSTAGRLAQDVQVSAYPHKYDAARETAVSMAAQYGVDLSDVGDPFPDVMHMAPPTSGPTPMPDVSMGSFTGNPTMAALGGSQTIRMGSHRGGGHGGGGVHVESLTMNVSLPNGSRKEVETLFENIRDYARSVSTAETLART